MHVLKKILPSFNLGYGDKEVYWIAATIAGDSFSFEPYLAGTYGDCGEILHFDPLSVPPTTSTSTPLPPIISHPPPLLPSPPQPLPPQAQPQSQSQSPPPTDPPAQPYFLNCQYLTEGIEKVGKNRQTDMSQPVFITPLTAMFDMGLKDTKSAGRCGACKAMGCGPVPAAVNEEIALYQQYHVDHAQVVDGYWAYHKVSVFVEKSMSYWGWR
jgi:hypothetical protein